MTEQHASTINIAQALYDLNSLAIPMKKLHRKFGVISCYESSESAITPLLNQPINK